MEYWKEIKNYEGLYQISNLGRVKALSRYVKHRHGGLALKKERILKTSLSEGYPHLRLCNKGISKTFNVHALMAVSFLEHTPNGHKLVVNHKNLNRADNRLENLEIVTNRENTNLKHVKSTSKYTGVSWNKALQKWASYIRINGIKEHLGYFKTELEASEMYNLKIKTI